MKTYKVKINTTNEKINLINNFKKLFQHKTDEEEKVIPEKERIGYLDISNVCMIIPKKEWVKATITELFNVTESKLPDLDYKVTKPDLKKEIKSKYNSYYLRILLEMTKNYDSITIKTKYDYPLWAECDDFIFILAPKYVDDWE